MRERVSTSVKKLLAEPGPQTQPQSLIGQYRGYQGAFVSGVVDRAPTPLLPPPTPKP